MNFKPLKLKWICCWMNGDSVLDSLVPTLFYENLV